MALGSLRGKGGAYSLFIVVCLAASIGGFTQTVMNAMLESVRMDLGIATSVGQWLTTVYMLVLGVTVPVVTWLSQRLSLKKIIYLALGFFLFGALIDFFAEPFLLLVVGRILQAIGAGIVIPILQAIALTRFPREKVGTMMGIAGIAMGFAPNIGPLIGGALVDAWGWRSFFLLLMGIVLVLLLATLLLIEDEGRPAVDSSLDIVSFAMSALGFGGLLLGFSNAANMSVASPFVWVPLAFGVVFLVLFVRRQNAVECPLINMRIFKTYDYVISFVGQNLMHACFMGITLIVPLYVQNLCGGTAIEAGLVFVPATICALVLNPIAGIAADKVGIRPTVLVGSTLLTAGSVAMAFMDASTPLWLVTLLQTIRGAGVSITIGPFITLGMRNLPKELAMDGSAFFSTTRQVCASLGTAAMVFVITMVNASTGTVSALAYQMAFGLSALFAVAFFVMTVWKVR